MAEPEMRVDHEIRQWPVGLNPTHDPLTFYQAPMSMPSSERQGVALEGRKSSNFGALRHQPVGEPMQSRMYNAPRVSIQTGPLEISQVAVMDGKPEQRHSVDQQKQQHFQLSNAPQTKAQQQRQALKKLSRVVSNEMDDSSVDLEQLLLRILARPNETDEGEDEQPETEQRSTSTRAQTDRSNKVFLTKSEAIKATQMISNLIKQSPGSAYSQPRKSNQGFTTNTKVCDICGYAVARVCDLKKHMKRHAKPYGCTYPKCHKRFGAKSDWKRHENSQHFQLEAFRCGQKSAGGQVCGEHFFRVEPFKRHLESHHKMVEPEEREAEAKARRIGKNCQQQFWCGFHNQIIVLKERRNAAWDERFDHIAYHFEKDKKSIEEWVCAEENKTKKELLKEMDRYVFDDDDERGVGAGGQPDVGPPPPPLPPMDVNTNVPSAPPMQQQTPPLAEDLPQIAGQKRGAIGEPSGTRSNKRHHRNLPLDVSQEMHHDAPSLIKVVSRYCVCILPLRIETRANSRSATAEMALVITRSNRLVQCVDMHTVMVAQYM